MSDAKNGMKLKFGGSDNTIDAMLLASTIKDLNTLLSVAAKQTDPDIETALVLKSTNSGCFEAYFDTVIGFGATLLNVEVPKVVKDVIEYLRLVTEHLRNKPPKEIVTDKSTGQPIVVLGDNNQISINQTTYNMYNNADVQKATANLCKNIFKSNRDAGLTISGDSAEECIELDKDCGKNWTDKVFEPEKSELSDETLINVTLPIIKPDLSQKGAWYVEYNHSNQWMTIEDESFLEQVKNGNIVFAAGDSLSCQLRIKFIKDSEGNPVVGSEKFSIKKVLKKIKHVEPVDMFTEQQNTP